MTITKSKTINFTIEDRVSTNRIMGQRGTMHIEVHLSFIDSDILGSSEYDGDYTVKWSSSFNENEPHPIQQALQDEVIELLLNSYYKEEDAFALDENRVYDFSYFEKYDIPYMVKYDCKRVESLIDIATKFLVDAGITDEPLDADGVESLIVDIRNSINLHEGNSVDVMSDKKIDKYAKILEDTQSVEFIYNGFFYEIFESADTGYVVNLYSSNQRDQYGHYLEKNCVDGGLCSGGSRDAIGFML